MLNNIKQRKDSGFTIVELLIVIVIIAILAAITIVAYNGIQNRANSAASQSAASNLSKKIEAYNAEKGTYPTTQTTNATYTTELNSVNSSSLVGSDIVLGTPSATNGKTTIEVSRCTAPATTNGYRIRYWDFSTGALSTTILTGTSGAACTTWTALT